MNHIKEFDKNAKTYKKYNIIQTQVAKELLEKIHTKPTKIVDLGCGTGTVYRLIPWEFEEYVAIDCSAQMLLRHPNKNVTKILQHFEQYQNSSYTDHFVLSSSALQWMQDLDPLFIQLQQTPFGLALFTSNTFKSLHKTAQTNSPILSKKQIITSAKRYLNADIVTQEYRLYFDTTLQMLQYIKRSGVSGGGQGLGYSSMKHLLKNYKKDYLEFEVVFITSPQIPAAHNR